MRTLVCLGAIVVLGCGGAAPEPAPSDVKTGCAPAHAETIGNGNGDDNGSVSHAATPCLHEAANDDSNGD